jgi:L-iditol 2-dehydrogenase
MRGLKLYGKEDLRLEEVPEPQCPEGGLLLRVEACAICGSDMRNYHAGGSGHGDMHLPIILGHELTGSIVESKSPLFSEGTMVGVQPAIACNRCTQCLKGYRNLCANKVSISYAVDGGFADYIAIPPEALLSGCVVELPEGASPIECSIAEPLGCAINGQEISNVSLGDSVLVIGGGPLGVMHALLAKIRGASKVIISEISEERADLIKDFNEIDRVATDNLERIVMEETSGVGADVIIVAAPSKEAQQSAIKLAAKRGRINFFGGLPKGNSQINIDGNEIHYKELFVHGTSDSTPWHYRKAIELIAGKKIPAAKIITHVMLLDDYKKALRTIDEGKALKVVIKP